MNIHTAVELTDLKEAKKSLVIYTKSAGDKCILWVIKKQLYSMLVERGHLDHIGGGTSSTT